MRNESLTQTFRGIIHSPFLRVLLIGFLILLLQIPVTMIYDVIREREQSRAEAIHEVTGKWGYSQSIIGPSLVVPYIVRFTEKGKDGELIVHQKTEYATFLPDDLNIVGDAVSQVRYRGIYKVPLYQLKLQFKGEFTKPNLALWGIDDSDILWRRAYLSVRISDARAITKTVSLNWNGKEISFLPGSGEFGHGQAGIHTPLEGEFANEKIAFSFPLELNGSSSMYFTPFGRKNSITVNSNWPDPSFQGNWLPASREITPAGFKANWDIPFLGRNFPQSWRNNNVADSLIQDSRFGVDFFTPVDQYSMARRSTKYAFFFLLLTFATIWLFEVLIPLRVHPLQYLLMGSGMCMFYLLELSLAEHIGFLYSYLAATAAIVLMICLYAGAVLGKFSRALGIAGVLLLLYGYLYVLLKNQDYALLVGSIGLFVMLGTVMYLTRRIDWYALPESEK